MNEQTRSQAVELALTARNLVAQGWCQDALALTADGKEVEPSNPDAVRWCVVGAEAFVGKESSYGRAFGLMYDMEAEVLGGLDPVYWNNAPERTQADVVEFFDEVARRLKEMVL